MDAVLRDILDLARWAPSADNTQPWRFQVLGERELVLWYAPGPDLSVFNLDHFAGCLAMGALLETLAVAATMHGLIVAETRPEPASHDYPWGIHVVLRAEAGVARSPLVPVVSRRTTQRRRMSLVSLSPAQKQALEASVGKLYRILWLEDWASKLKMASLLNRVGKVRLLMPETFAVHRDTIAWGAQHSDDRIPSGAIGADPLLQRIMAWTMKSQARVRMLNRMGGHLLPRVEMDLLPALACAGHFLVWSERPLDDPAAQMEAGRALQRFWLTAESLGLQFQPEMVAPLFCRYIRTDRLFTRDAWAATEMAVLCKRFSQWMGAQPWAQAAFMGRLGRSQPVVSRSFRQPLNALLVP